MDLMSYFAGRLSVSEKEENGSSYIEYPLPQDDYVYYRYPPCNEDRYIRIAKASIEYGELNANGYVKVGTMTGVENGSVPSGTGGTKVVYKYIIPAHKQDFIIKLSTLPLYAQSTAECIEVYCGALNWEVTLNKPNTYQYSSTTINGIKKITINTPLDYTQMYSTFNCLSYYQTIKLDTVNITSNSSGVFSNCLSLANLQYEQMTLKNPTEFFRCCGSLKDIDCSKIIPSGNIANMFLGCTLLETLDLSPWASLSSGITGIAGLIRYCMNLKTLNMSGWNLSHLTSLADWFDSNDKLENLILDDTIWVSANFSIKGCPKLTVESIAAIFNSLPELPEGTTKTFTLNTNHKMLQSQVDSANAKGWTVAGGTVVTEEEYNNG